MSQHQHHQHHQHHHHQHRQHHHHPERPVNPVLERLRAIAKPRVWGPIGIISLVSIFVWQVSEHPDWYQIEAEPEISADGLTAEERAIAAEIDSSGLLIEELHIGDPSAFNLFNTPIQGGEEVFEDVPPPESRDRASQPVALPEPELPILPSLLGQQSSSRQTAGNPFNSATTQQPSQMAPAPGLNPLGLPTFDTSASQQNPQMQINGRTPDNSALPASPLQAAMDQYLLSPGTEDTTQTRETPVDSINAIGTSNSIQAGTATTATTPSQPITADVPNTGIPLPASAAPVQVPQPTWVVPRTATSIDGTAATVQTPAPNPYQTNTTLPRPLPQTQQPNALPMPVLPPNPANPYGQYNYTGTNPYVNSPNYGNFGNSRYPNYQTTTPNPQNYRVGPSNLNRNNRNQVIRQQTPFSAPRRPPGRTIGGGRINTFSNP